MKEFKEELNSYAKPKQDELFLSVSKDAKLLEKLRLLGLDDKAIHENISLIADFQADQAICAACPGAKNCPKALTLSKVDLVYEKPILSRRIIPCEKNDVFVDPQYNFVTPYRDFPDEWLDHSRFSLPKTTRVAKVFMAFKKALNDPDHPWVYLTGESGVGKSFLLASFATGYAATGHSVAFVNTPSRFDQLKEFSIKEKGTFDDLMVRLATSDLLIFDDFGKEFHSDYVRDHLLLPLLNIRSKAKQLTFFSSIYSLRDIQDLWSYNRLSREPAQKMVALLTSELDNGQAISVPNGFETYLSKR
jgi:primosomal protein DnaI